jgi:phage tail sheath protein FI
VALTYPGVYVQELPPSVRAITGVSTSLTAFVGRALRGPTDAPQLVQGFGEFQRVYGGLWAASTLGYAASQFFAAGGSQALICRVFHHTAPTDPPDAKDAKLATATLDNNAAGIELDAANEGDWGNKLFVRVDQAAAAGAFNLSIKDTGTGAIEVFRNLSTDPANQNFIGQVLAQQSQLVHAPGPFPSSPLVPIPDCSKYSTPTPGGDPFSLSLALPPTKFSNGDDGSDITGNDVLGDQDSQTGIYMLEKVPLFNLLCLPPLSRLPSGLGPDLDPTTFGKAADYCWGRHAFLIADAPMTWSSVSEAYKLAPSLISGWGSPTHPDSAAIYFPRLLMPDPLKQNLLDTFAPCGVIAGIYAATDAARGVWKAPAGIDARLAGAVGLVAGSDATPITIGDGDNGLLNPLGVNCLRNFPVIGSVVWGARTADGADAQESQWKYIPVRRLAYYIEQSLLRGTQWVVFEPNAEPLWSQIRLDIGAFMQELFVQGAFQGTTPSEAYFVKCDSDTTTPTDIANGVVNIVVGFAPLEPAEFVLIQIQQIMAA